MRKQVLDRFVARFLFVIFVSFTVFATTLGMLVATSSQGYAARYDKGYSRETIKRMVVAEARSNGVVPPALALAVARVESNFRADVESSAGARGVMQIMPATARSEFGVPAKKLWNPEINIRLGVTFLERLYRQYGNRWELALSHYNGGTLKGGKGANARPHGYTRKYVADVTRHWRKFTRSRVVLAAAEATKEYETRKSQTIQSRNPSSAYWLLEEQGVEKNWRDYLKEADRILSGRDMVAEADDLHDGYDDEVSVPAWYDSYGMRAADKDEILRKRFRRSLRESEQHLNGKRKQRFM